MNQNSVFIGWVKLWLQKLYGVYEKSITHKILNKIYLFFSNAWASSFIIGILGKSCGKGKGLFWNVFTWLFSLPQKIGRVLRVEKLVRESKIVRSAYGFLTGVLALNTRMLALLLLGFGIGGSVSGLVIQKEFSLWLLLPLLAGVILRFFNYDITDSAKHSKIIGFLLDSFALDFSFQAPQKAGGLFLGAMVGFLGGILSGIHILLGIAAIFAVCGCLAVVYRPFFGTVLCIILAPFVPTMVLAALVIFTFFSLVLYSMTHGDFKWRLDWTGVAIIGFLLITWLSVFSSYHRSNSIMVGAITSVFVFFYFCVINTVTKTKKASILFKLFVISGCIVAIYGILQYVMGWGTNVVNAWLDEEMFEDTKFRVYSTLENPNVLGEYLLLIAFVCGGLICAVKKEWQKIVYTGILAAVMVCLVLTQSRGCWLGFMVGFAMFITFTNGRLWGFLPLCLAALPFVLPQSIIDRFASIGNLEDSSSSYRVFIWLGTLQMLKDFWISGVGMGEQAYNSVYPFYSYNAIVAPHSHNLYLQLLVHSGIPALILFIGIVWITARLLVMNYRANGKRSETGFLSAAIGCGIAAFLFQGIFDYVFYNYRVMMIFWAVMGMAVSLYHTGKENSCD